MFIHSGGSLDLKGPGGFFRSMLKDLWSLKFCLFGIHFEQVSMTLERICSFVRFGGLFFLMDCHAKYPGGQYCGDVNG